MTWSDLLPPGMSPIDAIAFLAGLAAFTAVLSVWNGLVVRDPMAGRAKSIMLRQKALRAGLTAPNQRRERKKTADAMGVVQRIIEKLNLLRTKQADQVKDRLAQAGWRSKDGVVLFLFFKVCLPFVFAGLAILFLTGLHTAQAQPIVQMLIAMIAVVVGAYAPEVFVKNAIQKRQQALQEGLPDALDLLVICAEAGLSLDAALKRVAKETAHACPAIADEFSLTSVELGFLPDRKTALDNLNKRTQLPSIRGVVNTLAQTEKYGTPLAHSLRVLSAEFRKERMMKAEEKAAKLPATLTVPMILFILPPLFVVLLGPAVIKSLDNLSLM